MEYILCIKKGQTETTDPNQIDDIDYKKHIKTISKINHAHGKSLRSYSESAREAKVGPRIRERKSGEHCVPQSCTLPDRQIIDVAE